MGAVVSGAHILQLGANRELELRDAAASLLWSTNTGGVASIELLELGNLLMLDSSNSILWQSFDHPNNVLLPGQILTPGMKLVAGDYSAVMEAGGFVLYVNSADRLPYLVLNSTWGLSNLNDILHPACSNGLSLVYAAKGDVLTMELDLGNASASPGCYNASTENTISKFSQSVTSSSNSSGFRYLKLKSNGELNTFVDDQLDFSWFNEGDDGQGRGFCNLPSHCGEFGICDPGGECRCPNPIPNNQSSDYFISLDYTAETPETDGCSMIQPVNCTTQTTTTAPKLLRLQDLDYFPHRYMSDPANTSLQICLGSCLHNCSCIVAFYNNQTQACHHYNKMLSMQRTTYGGNFLVYLKIMPVDREAGAAHNLNFVAIAIIFGTSLLGGSLIFLWVYRRWGHSGTDQDYCRRERRSEEDAFFDSISGLPPRYSVKQLKQITNGFTVKLGAGGFGSVYEGTLPDGLTKIAVKKLEGKGQGDKEFRAEVASLAGLNHVNLVQLRGFCAEEGHRMVVYEHMTNGSLDKWLHKSHDKEPPPLLDWETRFQIAIDTARGLAFLHGDSRERIFHLDVKPQNILLDDKFRAKLSDFGLSKQLERGRSRTETSMRGTPGYLAPEWLLQMSVSDKSDVYSYGMVLMEVVSGRRNVDYSSSSEKWYWPAWVLKKVQGKQWQELTEEIGRGWIRSGGVDAEITRAVKVALWCLQEDPRTRPPMAMVLLMLEGHVLVDDPPLQLQLTLEAQAKLLADLHPADNASSIAISSTIMPGALHNHHQNLINQQLSVSAPFANLPIPILPLKDTPHSF